MCAHACTDEIADGACEEHGIVALAESFAKPPLVMRYGCRIEGTRIMGKKLVPQKESE